MFKVGDEVVCVNDAPRPGRVWAGTPPVIGRTYTVTGLFPSPFLDGFSLLLAEIENAEGFGYADFRFRKVERRNDSLSIEAFLTIKPGQYEEPKRAPAKKRERVQ